MLERSTGARKKDFGSREESEFTGILVFPPVSSLCGGLEPCGTNSLVTRCRGKCLGPKTGATHNNAQLELPDNGRAITGLVVCYVVSMI